MHTKDGLRLRFISTPRHNLLDDHIQWYMYICSIIKCYIQCTCMPQLLVHVNVSSWRRVKLSSSSSTVSSVLAGGLVLGGRGGGGSSSFFFSESSGLPPDLGESEEPLLLVGLWWPSLRGGGERIGEREHCFNSYHWRTCSINYCSEDEVWTEKDECY